MIRPPSKFTFTLVAFAALQMTAVFAQLPPSTPPIPPRPPSNGHGNDYFEGLRKRPETVFAYSLRTETQVSKYARHYNPVHATYDPVMDATRMTLQKDKNSLATQIWLPIYQPEKGQTVIIWDWRPGAGWTWDNGLRGHKMFQVRRDKNQIWFEAGTGYLQAPVGSLHSRVRVYASVGPNTWLFPNKGFDFSDAWGTVHYNSDSIGPVHANFVVPRETWARFMIVIEQQPGDKWARVWYYAAHEGRDPTLILGNVEIALPSKPAGIEGEGRPRHFDFEINSSQGRIGPAVSSYGRNVIVMRNVVNPVALMARPKP